MADTLELSTPKPPKLDDAVELNATPQPHPPPPSPPANLASSLHTSSRNVGLSQMELDEKPWKYIGYRGYTEFLASENDFLIFRRFTSASTRVALMLQHQMSVLEEELNQLDITYSRRNAVDVNNGSFRDDEDDRLQVIENLRVKLLEYSTCLSSQTKSYQLIQRKMNLCFSKRK